MKYIFLICLFSLGLLSQPKIMIEGGDVVDWGTIKDQEEPLKTKIKILNIGNDTLRITSVKT